MVEMPIETFAAASQMTEFQREAIETLRQLTLQMMLISAGVFGIVGGFVSASTKKFFVKWSLAGSLVMFAISAMVGYLLHGAMISLLHAGSFSPFHDLVVWLGFFQISIFVLGGCLFTFFVVKNLGT